MVLFNWPVKRWGYSRGAFPIFSRLNLPYCQPKAVMPNVASVGTRIRERPTRRDDEIAQQLLVHVNPSPRQSGVTVSVNDVSKTNKHDGVLRHIINRIMNYFWVQTKVDMHGTNRSCPCTSGLGQTCFSIIKYVLESSSSARVWSASDLFK